jgi:integrase
METTHRNTKASRDKTNLPGTIYARNKRYWWKIQLPGETKPVARPLVPLGSKFATTDYLAAVECAKILLQNHLFKKDVPLQGDIHTIPDLARAYTTFIKTYYVDPTGQPTREVDNIKYGILPLIELYPSLPVEDFGPLRLKEVREAMIDKKWCRTQINRRIGIIKRMVKWAVSEQILSPVILHGLQSVTGLKRGRTRAEEKDRILPVDEKHVYAVLPYATPVAAAMIELQLLTGMRPAELCQLRPCDLDRTGAVWHYYPEKHKNVYRQIERIVSIGPRGQEILRPFLLRPADSPCFSPEESEQQRLKLLHEKRITSLKYGNRPGTNRKENPQKKPGKQFNSESYRQSVEHTIGAANRAITKEAKEKEIKNPELIPAWTPYQLRHTAATKVRKEMGYETAGATLGHTNMSATAIYAERNQGLADEAAKRFG